VCLKHVWCVFEGCVYEGYVFEGCVFEGCVMCVWMGFEVVFERGMHVNEMHFENVMHFTSCVCAVWM